MSTIFVIFVALLGVPLFAVMGFSALTWILASEDGGLQNIILSINGLREMPLLDSLPLFAFSGYLLARSGASRRLIRFSNALVGWLPGGLAVVAIWMCTLVTAVTGASGVTIVAVGGILLPALISGGYKERFSLGALTTGGSLGLLFPPSLPVIIYGVVAEVSIEDLFKAGLLPGLLILSLLSAYAMFRGQRDSVPRSSFSTRELLVSFGKGSLEIPLPIFLMVGIYGGYITVGEAAVIATAFLLIVEVLIFRDIGFLEIGNIARESLVLVGGILLILAMAMAVTANYIDADVPQRMFEAVSGLLTSKLAFLLGLNLFLLLVGCMIDIYAAIALIVPLIIPIAEEYDINMVHLGIVFLVNMGIGYATPPVGLNLFIASVRFKQPVLKLYWACLPFIAILLVALALITYFPQISLCLLPAPE